MSGRGAEAYAGAMTSNEDRQREPSQTTRTRWKLLLILPYVGLCFPGMYAQAAPSLWGFPFFYWYQFAWVIVASAVMGLVYRKLRY